MPIPGIRLSTIDASNEPPETNDDQTYCRTKEL